MEKILDLHIHSKYSRACSRELTLPKIADACAVRGIDFVATGDFTHPAWFLAMREELIEVHDGVFRAKASNSATRFIIGTELSCIYSHAGAVRRVHLLVFAPTLRAVEKIIAALESRKCNLRADGRPILGLSAKELLALILEADARCVMIPAHAWTPWFAVFGSKSGYTSLAECFEDLTPHIRAIETGLSSDPAMNWRLSALDNVTLLSNSDAHSLRNLGREANVFAFDREEDITYDEIMRIIQQKDRARFLSTIEFFPEEGKYHCDGHRSCGFSCMPEETRRLQGLCPKCHRQLTVGVLNRVDTLADRPLGFRSEAAIPFRSIIPLPEIIADVFDVGVSSKRVQRVYDDMTKKIGSEFFILLHAPLPQLRAASPEEVVQAIARVREGNVRITPGFDGEFGTVRVFADAERPRPEQIGLF